EVFVREGLIWNLWVLGQLIRSTAEHPFFVKGKGWTPLNRINAGDAIWTEASGWVTVEVVEETGQWETVYNFRIADHHTYFVGCHEWGFSVWAHNLYAPGEEVALRTALEQRGFSPAVVDAIVARGAAADVPVAAGSRWAALWGDEITHRGLAH